MHLAWMANSIVQCVFGWERVDAMSESRIQKETERVVEEGLQGVRLTEKKRRFMQEIVKDPGNPTQAAILAGYKPTSAKYIASRLMKDPMVQTALAAHFLDHEERLTTLLSQSLVRLGKIVAESNDAKFLRAFDKVMAYTKIATKILGVMPQVPKGKGANLPEGPMDLRELREAHAREIERIDQLLDARGVEALPLRSGEITIQ